MGIVRSMITNHAGKAKKNKHIEWRTFVHWGPSPHPSRVLSGGKEPLPDPLLSEAYRQNRRGSPKIVDSARMLSKAEK